MIAVGNRSFHTLLCWMVGLMATWAVLSGTALAQAEAKPSETKPTESRPAAGQVPVPFSPSAFSWLRMAFAPGREVLPANRLPFESLRDKRSLFEGSALGNFHGNVSDQAEFHRIVSDLAREDEERAAQAAEEYILPAIQQVIPADPLQAATDQLRASARNLDNAAADLEDAGKYAEADRVRSSAQRLRREARELAKPDTDEIRVIK